MHEREGEGEGRIEGEKEGGKEGGREREGERDERKDGAAEVGGGMEGDGGYMGWKLHRMEVGKKGERERRRLIDST